VIRRRFFTFAFNVDFTPHPSSLPRWHQLKDAAPSRYSNNITAFRCACPQVRTSLLPMSQEPKNRRVAAVWLRSEFDLESDLEFVFDFDFKRGVPHVRPSRILGRANVGTFVPVLKISSPLYSAPKLILNLLLTFLFPHTTKSISTNALPLPVYDE
jgi:hypothetical protein